MRRWHGWEVVGIGLKHTFCTKVPPFRSDWDSQGRISGWEPDRRWRMETFAWSLLHGHSCVFFLFLGAVWNKGITSPFTPNVPSAFLGLILEGLSFFQHLFLGQVLLYYYSYWTLAFHLFCPVFSSTTVFALRKGPWVFSFPPYLLPLGRRFCAQRTPTTAVGQTR